MPSLDTNPPCSSLPLTALHRNRDPYDDSVPYLYIQIAEGQQFRP